MVASNIDLILQKHVGARRDSLIPILQEVQEAYGFLSRDSILRIGQHLGLPASKVYGVATFYNQFRFKAPGKFHVQVCRGTACHVKGSARLLDATAKVLGVKPGDTTRDGLYSLEVVACLGACGLAPVLAVNGEFHASVSPDSVKRIMDSYRGKA
ncbi:MAG: NADH-quinone oxidoreductase subunit NuoE [Planctomycetota bacterium]|nr:NADH-quinone oxidoreductase subunit NuoE [Planctomycetota bacterium]